MGYGCPAHWLLAISKPSNSGENRPPALFAKGNVVLASVARELEVSRMSVCRWYRQSKKSGRGGSERNGPRWQNATVECSPTGADRLRAPRRSPLSRLQRRPVDPSARGHRHRARHGCPVSTPGHVWKVLGAMNWFSRKPEQEAKERSADAVEYGKKVRWPEVKNCAAARLVPSCRS